MIQILDVFAVVFAGSMVGNELAIAAFVHPAFCRLPDDVHLPSAVAVARILGRFMPFWYGLVFLLAFADALVRRHNTGQWPPLITISATLWAMSIVYTIAALVPLNNRIASWTEATRPLKLEKLPPSVGRPSSLASPAPVHQLHTSDPRDLRSQGPPQDSRDGAAELIVGFNPRARVGRDAISARNTTISTLFRSTRPRGSRHWLAPPTTVSPRVSIHAPAWGAIDSPAAREADSIVSIHAPAWGATLTAAVMARLIAGFNPRARVGRDYDEYGRFVGPI